MMFKVQCELESCAWKGSGPCQTLGRCGAAHILEKAKRRGGYLVYERDNPVVDALRNAGRVCAGRTKEYGVVRLTA